MANTSQLLKGILEGCILKIISEKETYGYELYSSLSNYGFTDLSEGTLYPLLIRLEKNKLLSSVTRDSPLGPKRKYYSLTKLGESELIDFCKAWDDISKSVNKILDGDSNE
ncbi:PadR family transcriptional regulator [Clostridium sp. JN-1]|uniref:PadR family transcriptional regulator n=1 Tax=Clostridium sp. JN-1 TaxID=2483110 RepID=UPI000F0B87F6|nr:PadR family transcriptional regulator [Clostridium sp. JN-1]